MWRPASVMGLLVVAAWLGGVAPARTTASRAGASAGHALRGVAADRAVRTFQALPLSFEPNRGQVDGAVRFFARGPGYTLFLTGRDTVMVLQRTVSGHGCLERGSRPAFARPAILHLRLLGANPHPRTFGANNLPGTVNYFIGNDPRRWHTNIPTYARVHSRNVYPGIDVLYYGQRGQLEYDWLVAPGANPDRIRQTIEGASALQVDRHGNLAIRIGGLLIRQSPPLAYQRDRRGIRSIAARYVLAGKRTVGLALGRYDARRPLVIDPTLVYSTFLGGSGAEGGLGIAADSRGDAYITGDTQSTDFPVAGPAQASLTSDPSCVQSQGRLTTCTDVFVSKLSSDGSSLLYSTYLGGSLDDFGYGIAVDLDGSAYITGNTLSRDFPTRQAYQAHASGGTKLGDVFVARLSPAGSSLIYSTYLGGAGEDDGQAIAVSGGNAYVTGSTTSGDFPTAHALQPAIGGGTCGDASAPEPCSDAFVTELDASGSGLVYSTFLGGGGADAGTGIAVRGTAAYVAGRTDSQNFPTQNALQRSLHQGQCGAPDAPTACNDAFVAEVAPAGKRLVYSTYLGGAGEDAANDLTVDQQGSAYVVGQTGSSDFPVVHSFQSAHLGSEDVGFATKIDPKGSSIVYSTYLGGSGTDVAYGVAVDAAGNAYLTGSTLSKDFPVRNAVQTTAPGDENVQNGFITELDSSGTGLVYSTYLGGTDHDLGADIALDPDGNVYITGFATSTDFPTTHALQGEHAGGGFDTIVAKIAAMYPPIPTATPTATASPLPTRTPLRTGSKHSCKKGYKLVHGKCRKKKRLSDALPAPGGIAAVAP